MPLTAQEREEVWQEIQDFSDAPGFTNKSQLRTWVDETDDLVALPAFRNTITNNLSEPAKTTGTVRQKRIVLYFVLAKILNRRRRREGN